MHQVLPDFDVTVALLMLSIFFHIFFWHKSSGDSHDLSFFFFLPSPVASVNEGRLVGCLSAIR